MKPFFKHFPSFALLSFAVGVSTPAIAQAFGPDAFQLQQMQDGGFGGSIDSQRAQDSKTQNMMNRMQPQYPQQQFSPYAMPYGSEASKSQIEPLRNGLPVNVGQEVPKKLSNLQKYLKDSTGKVLPYFSEELFDSGSFEASVDTPVPSNYQIGPGDEIMLRVWGGISTNYSGTVDRDGLFSVPRVGTFPVAGVTMGDLNSYLTQQIGKYYKNFNVSASLGQLRGIQIYVVGQAEKPGLYTVSSMSSLVTSVFSVAKPGVNGSYRNIVLKRGGEEVASLDLYAFMRDGDTSSDKKLVAGDVIVIEKAGPRVAVLGAVEKPAIFELKAGEPLGVAIDLAGVQGALTAKSEVLIERFAKEDLAAPRKVLRKPYQEALADTGAQDGEVVKLFDVSDRFANAITLRGNVMDQMRVPFKQGIRVSDLIPDERFLIRRNYYREKEKLINIGSANLLDEKEYEYGPMGRSREAKLKMRKAEDAVSLEEVGNSVRNLLNEINWDYAVVERLDDKALKTVLLPFNLRKAIAKDEKEDLALQPGDVVTVFSVKDAAVPKDKRTITVKVQGEVQAPGFYQVEPGETLQDVLLKAGGLTRNAFVFGTRLSRLSLKETQQRQLDKVVEEAEKQLAGAQRNNAGNLESAVDIQAAENQINRQQALLNKLRTTPVEGRLILDIPFDAQALFDVPAIPMEDGDQITIPFVPSYVAVNGAVFNSGSYVFSEAKSLGYYLQLAGGATKLADDASTFVVRANGQVISAQQDRFLSTRRDLDNRQALPGDLVFVPEDYEYRLSFLKTVAQVSQVFYQLGLGVAAVESIRR